MLIKYYVYRGALHKVSNYAVYIYRPNLWICTSTTKDFWNNAIRITDEQAEEYIFLEKI